MFSLGNVLKLTTHGRPRASEYPHATEDLIVSHVEVVGSVPHEVLYQEFLGEAKPTLNDVFYGNVISVRLHPFSSTLINILGQRPSKEICASPNRVSISWVCNSPSWSSPDYL